MNHRPSTPNDISKLKLLWKLAFHDEDSYINNFFINFTLLDKIYLTETPEGEIIAMTVCFPTTFHRKGKTYQFAYLYAVATHLNWEKKGIASSLLHFVYEKMQHQGFHGVTTVPATPTLHPFFAKNGFEEYFSQEVAQLPPPSQNHSHLMIEKITATTYESLVKTLFSSDINTKSLPFTSHHPVGYLYQESLCHLLSPTYGFFKLTEKNTENFCIFTLEPMSSRKFLVKEVLGTMPPPEEFAEILAQHTGVSSKGTEYRYPTSEKTEKTMNFGMIQWLTPPPEDWNPQQTGECGYLGLAFD